MTERDKVAAAAEALERMADELKTIAVELRVRPDDARNAYSLVYEFRWRFGREVVNKLGHGTPSNRRRPPR